MIVLIGEMYSSQVYPPQKILHALFVCEITHIYQVSEYIV